MKNYRIKHFTLIELLAAMAVFSVLLVVSLRLFSGAQHLWIRSEQKTNTFADARLAMEYIAFRMQSLVYETDFPFYIRDNNHTDQIWFPSRIPPKGDGYAGNSFGRNYLQFTLVEPLTANDENAGKLRLRYFNGGNNKITKRKYSWIFNAYNENNRYFKNAGDAFDFIKNAFDSSLDEEFELDIIENVIGFNLIWYNGIHSPKAGASDSDWELRKNTTEVDSKTPPYLVEVEIKMLDSKESFKKWQSAAAAKRDEVFSEYGYTFRRAVLIGKKGVRNGD